jgi:hypothetical protein
MSHFVPNKRKTVFWSVTALLILFLSGLPSLTRLAKPFGDFSKIIEVTYREDGLYKFPKGRNTNLKNTQLLDPVTFESLKNQLQIVKLISKKGRLAEISENQVGKIIPLDKNKKKISRLLINSEGEIFVLDNRGTIITPKIITFNADYFSEPQLFSKQHRLTVQLRNAGKHVVLRRINELRPEVVVKTARKKVYLVKLKSPSGYQVTTNQNIIYLPLVARDTSGVGQRPSASPTPKPSASPSPRPTASGTPSPKPTRTVSPNPTASATPRPTQTVSPQPTESETSTPQPTLSASPRPTETGTPVPVVCGNGLIERGEVCDLGSNNGKCLAGSRCFNQCQGSEECAECGNGFVEGMEACDPPGVGTCSLDCLSNRCGNGSCEGPRETVSTCAVDCATTLCGNGLIDRGEVCDLGSNNGKCVAGSRCFNQCQGSEECTECGNGFVEGMEACDPPGAGTCSLDCLSNRCGNGSCESPRETVSTCAVDCATPVCGNGSIERGEVCDLGSNNGKCVAGSRCFNQCQGSEECTECGNGFVEGMEACDPPGAGTCSLDCLSNRCGNGSCESPRETVSTCAVDCAR